MKVRELRCRGLGRNVCSFSVSCVIISVYYGRFWCEERTEFCIHLLGRVSPYFLAFCCQTYAVKFTLKQTCSETFKKSKPSVLPSSLY
jgi:hypothetical protein